MRAMRRLYSIPLAHGSLDDRDGGFLISTTIERFTENMLSAVLKAPASSLQRCRVISSLSISKTQVSRHSLARSNIRRFSRSQSHHFVA